MTPFTSYTVADLALRVNGGVGGDGACIVHGLNKIDSAGEHEITFLSNEAYVKFLGITKASCVLVRREHTEEVRAASHIVVEDPYKAFVILMQDFFPSNSMPPGVRSTSATIDPLATIHPLASIGPGCVVGKNCVLGANVQLVANVVLYPETTIGESSVLHSNVTCYSSTVIGEHCIIHAGAVIGSDGFGFLEEPNKSFIKIPQVGSVRIGNNVEVGANTTIDRAAVGETVIGDGVKLDNLVHIAHGVHVGEHTAIAAQTGVSGSTTLGKRNRLAGQVGIVGHITTTDDVVVYSQSGVSKNVTQPGIYFGTPIKDHLTALRIEAAIRQLPTALQELRDVQRELSELKDKTTP